ncbi:hypothetical protein GTY54_18275 [Streptomyces sp. SID625]|nr:hypothetical protein [Streptomyces sp. SID625]
MRRAFVVLASAACPSTAVAGVASADAPARDGSRTVSAGTDSAAAVEHYGNMATGGCLDDSEYGLRVMVRAYNRYQTWR